LHNKIFKKIKSNEIDGYVDMK